jgi:hypothetical protein
MNTLEGLPLHHHYKKLQATEEKKYAWKVVQDFFNAFDEEGVQETLWFILSSAMKLESEEISGTERSNMLFFHDYSQTFFKAVHFLHREYQKKKGTATEDHHDE